MLLLAVEGLIMAFCFAGMALLGDLRQNLIPFLVLYGVAYAAYATAVSLDSLTGLLDGQAAACVRPNLAC